MKLREGDFEGFFQAPFVAYGKDTPYISPMKGDLRRFYTAGENPLFARAEDFCLFTVEDSGHLRGRIGVHVHRAANEKFGTNTSYFAYFDCADDAEAARVLLGAAEGWARERGFDRLAGNFNLTAMQQIGVMTGGFEATPFVDQVYSPPHIARLLEANDFEAYFPMQTFAVDLDRFSSSASSDQGVLASPDWQFAPVTRSTIPARLGEARELLNSGFADNPMFVALSEAEFDFQAKELQWLIDPRITAVLHYGGEPAAIALVIPDLNPFIKATRSRIGLLTPWHFLVHHFRRDRALLVYMAVRKDLQGQGVMGALLADLLPRIRQAGYRQLGITWVWDGNRGSLRQMERIGAKPLHRTHLFQKALG